MVTALEDDPATAPLDPPTRALVDHAVKLTRAPWTMGAADVEALRAHGFDDRAIHDATQVAAYFNYINRVCDGLGVALEDFMPPRPPGWGRNPRR